MQTDKDNRRAPSLISRAFDQAEHLSVRVAELIHDQRITVFTFCAVISAVLFVLVCLWLLFSGFLDRTV